jgi:4'-phosphopantetheinyl transferase
MPLVFIRKNNGDQIALWQIAPDEFDEPEKKSRSNSFNGLQNKRLKQRQACLHMVAHFAGSEKKIFYDDHGKPHFEDHSGYVSFSHSGDYAAIMLSNNFAGIDFELIRPKILNIIHKFLNEPELNSLFPETAVEHAHIYWGAKEAVYKIYGRQQLIFKEHILIRPFEMTKEKGFFYASLNAPDYKKEFRLYYEKMFGHMLVHVVSTK